MLDMITASIKNKVSYIKMNDTILVISSKLIEYSETIIHMMIIDDVCKTKHSIHIILTMNDKYNICIK